MFLCFAVEELEWEFRDNNQRQGFDISNSGQTMKKKIGGYASMRLNNQIRINSKYKMNVRVKSEVKNNALMRIGLVNSEHWDKSIVYDHRDGQICDNNQKIKRVNTKLNKDSIIKIKNEIIRKTDNNEKIFKMSFTINDVELCVFFYQDVQPKVPYLWLGVVVELDVEVISKILIIF